MKAPANLEQIRQSLLQQAAQNEKSAEMWEQKTRMLGAGVREALDGEHAQSDACEYPERRNSRQETLSNLNSSVLA